MEPINITKTLLLDSTNIPDINAWKQTNNEAGLYFPEDLTTNPHFLVDFSQITDLAIGADWLKRNQSYICYNESYVNIHNLHIIDIYNSDLDDKISSRLTATTGVTPLVMSVLELCSDANIQTKFSKYDYDKYIVFEVVNNKVTYSVKDYDASKSCFSFPFFRSILEVNQVKNNFSKCIFSFTEISIEYDWKLYNTIAFKVTFPDGTKSAFYDFSHIPPGSSSPELLNTTTPILASPLSFKLFI